MVKFTVVWSGGHCTCSSWSEAQSVASHYRDGVVYSGNAYWAY